MPPLPYAVRFQPPTDRVRDGFAKLYPQTTHRFEGRAVQRPSRPAGWDLFLVFLTRARSSKASGYFAATCNNMRAGAYFYFARKTQLLHPAAFPFAQSPAIP